VALALAIILNTVLLRAFTGAAVEKAALPFTNLNFYIANKYYSLDTGDKGSLLIQGIFLLSAISMWVAAYYRLKEKRV
jgi:energy-converting hydrogenase Eha subunit G